MPVYELPPDRYDFPPTSEAEPNGLLAIGGDLSPGRLLRAYSLGIFPWYSDPEPYLWWSPAPRLVLFPSEIKVSKSMRSLFRRKKFEITVDQHFNEVIRFCAYTPRAGQLGTWITEQMQAAYSQLHREGFAHSVEVWDNGELIGGLYGISLGKIFFGESMFTLVPNASKYALIHLAHALQRLDFDVIDCQQRTNHLVSLGAREVSRNDFEFLLYQALNSPTLVGSWAKIPELIAAVEV